MSWMRAALLLGTGLFALGLLACSSSSSGGGSGAGPDVSGGVGSGCGSVDAANAATISGYIDKLPNQVPAGATRTAAIDAIQKACAALGPTASGWKPEYCWAHLAAAISKESGYTPTASVLDGYGTRDVGGMKANDPVVGMLQIRFSSTVHEIVSLGNVDRIACTGCKIPASVMSHASEAGDSAFWAVTGPSENMSLMTDVACNVAMGAWYYYENATGNGRASKVTYTDEYCAGGGTAGNLVTGLMSHLLGDENGKGVIANDMQLAALKSQGNGAFEYVSEIKTNWDSMVGPVSGTHPFYMLLPPSPKTYCK